MILRNFPDKSGWLYVFDKRSPIKVVRRSRIQNAFVENNIYLQYTTDKGRKSYSIEHDLCKIEDAASAVVRKIVDLARKSSQPNLTTQEKQDWDTYFRSQLTRTPDVRPTDEELDAFRHQIADELLRIRPLSPAAISTIEHVTHDTSIVARTNQNIRAQLAIPTGRRLSNVISEKGLLVARITKSNRSFIIGSNSIVKVTTEGRTNLADPDVQAWIPIAHDVAVTPALTSGKEEFVPISDNDFVRWLNEATLNQSTEIAGRSRDLVESITRKLRASVS